MTVFDASAIIAYLKEEPGADLIEARLGPGSACSAANWAEIAQKILDGGGAWPEARLGLLASGLVVEPVTASDAESAAKLWARGNGLSLADRLCLALGSRLGTEIVTCDKQWEGRPGVVLAR